MKQIKIHRVIFGGMRVVVLSLAFLRMHPVLSEERLSSCDEKSFEKAKDITCSFDDFVASIVKIPQGQTNVVYYAGTSNDVSVLVHEDNEGVRFWNITNARIGKGHLRAYTPDKKQWILLKDNASEKLSCWDTRAQIHDFVDRLSVCSAIVRPESCWYEMDEFPSTEVGCIYVRQESLVCSTLCNKLKVGGRIRSSELLDVSSTSNAYFVAQMKKHQAKRWGYRCINGDLSLAVWSGSLFYTESEMPEDKVLCVTGELIAPFHVYWDLWCDGLLDFNEQTAIDFYKKRASHQEGGSR